MNVLVVAEMISVILPTFNRRTLLAEAIRSVQAQTFSAWELLVVDDGSTDGTTDTLPDDPRISLIARTHTGNVAALHNAGLAKARGTMIGFLDSDDRWLPDKLALQVNRLQSCPECDWCYGRFRLFDSAHPEIPTCSGFDWRPREGRLLKEVITTEAGISLQTVLVRRELALALRFTETIPWGDDYDFLFRLALASPACVVDRIIAEAREHAGRGTRHRYDQMLNFATTYYRGARLVDDPDMRRLCRQRAITNVREYLAHARAAGELTKGLRAVGQAWWRG
jgi:glycosyltransferase involved in cell wall biosynthesis